MIARNRPAAAKRNSDLSVFGFVHCHEARSTEALRGAARRLGLPTDVIIELSELDPRKILESPANSTGALRRPLLMPSPVPSRASPVSNPEGKRPKA